MVVPCRGAGRRRGSAADDGSGAEKRGEKERREGGDWGGERSVRIWERFCCVSFKEI